MTRETKIGLLVGLAFIIVIGILLSDHMSATNEPPQAMLAGAGTNVREAVAAPSAGGAQAPLASPVVVDGPRSPVPTHTDLNPPKPPVGIVQVGPGGAEPPVAIHGRDPAPAAPAADRATPRPATPPSGGAVADSGAAAPIPGGNRMLNELVLGNPDDLTPVGPGGQPGAARTPAVDPSAPRHYTAQPGDTVSRLAGRFYGTNNKANRDLIINANPPLQAEGNPVIVGKVYVLPNAGLLPQSPAAPGRAATPPAVATRTPTPAPADTLGAGYYTVKENDSLWKIAEAQLGSGNAWTTIRDLNADVLKGGETVTPNMRLRLPSKPIVSASAN